MEQDKNNWQWQLQNSIKTPEQLSKYINLTEQEYKDIEKITETYKMSITPYYASLMDKDDPDCPIRKMVIPVMAELENTPQIPSSEKEESFEKVTGLRQEFKEKCTILLTLMCPNYCRYCFRKYWVGRMNNVLTYEQIDDVVKAIENNKNIEEVCISGGDPLMLSDEYIDYVLTKLKTVKHLGAVRLYTRTLAFLPQRITDNLVKVLKKHPTLYVCTHFNHPKELTDEAMAACRKIVNNGMSIYNQSVLLKGVNDNSKVMKELFWGLVKNKVKPLYLQHCIKTMGNDHLVTKIDVGQKIIKDLYCHMSVLGIPLYDVILYSGKVLMMPDYVEKDEQGKKYFKNLHGEKFYLDNLE
ncbi:MAG: KamA family radical SAM protein [bacterium]